MALTRDPSTGAFIDPATGMVFADAAGTAAITDPNIKAQAQRNLAVANQLFARLAGLNSNYNQTLGQQQQLGHSLDQQVRGTAPSVASNQLYSALDNIRRNQDSTAAGSTATNQGLGHYVAAQNTGEASAAANQAAAGARANEIAEATRAKMALLNGEQQATGQMYGSTLSGATTAGNTAAGVGETQANIDQKNKEMWMNFATNAVNGVGAGAVRLATTP